ncbi:LAMI_0E05600g1_1 [Lachancea mirantina]|uniref:Dolichyl-diphosphooligosaccharide--protein glycosyltransferase subunit WBP1 n=1 Tax=Lachancea mirantina TaxID=1230905 RepID=A0A1G4JL90_9SACH|nr:LAMI_0E05600g1_1 [Lachancea mirantina]
MKLNSAIRGLVACLLFVCSTCEASIAKVSPSSSKRTLIIYDKKITDLRAYSDYFENLAQLELDLEFVSVVNDTKDIELFDKGVKLYSNVVLFPLRSRKISKDVTAETLIRFSAAGGNVLAITSPQSSTEAVRTYLNELGIYPSPKGYQLSDHFQSRQDGTLQLDEKSIRSNEVISADGNALLYNGSAALLKNSELLFPVLRAPKTSFTKSSRDEGEWTTGTQGFLAAGFQSLKNARAAWVGSESFFSNAFYEVNAKAVMDITKWAFLEKGVIRSLGASHSHRDGSTYNEEPYKIKDDIIYTIGLSEWRDGSWKPFNSDDVQLEIKMIDPYYRVTLNPSNATEEVQFYTSGEIKLPDHHGVFSFITDYKRNGYSFVFEKDVKAIRHLANDEYPRSWEISNSWVYLTSIFAVGLSWMLFVFFYLTSRPKSLAMPEKKMQ